MRPTWDETWMTMAELLAKRSHDDKFQVGCLIVTKENSRVISCGYNGNAPGLPHEKDSDVPGQSGFIHAETNCLIKMDYNDPSEKIMYVTLSPCLMCAKLVLAARIKEVVYRDDYRDTSGLEILKKYGVSVRQFPEKKVEIKKGIPPPLKCLNCNTTVIYGRRIVTASGSAYCSMGCAGEDGQDWAEK